MNAVRARRSGFTLVELMTVVALFGVIAALALVSFGRTRRQDDLDGFSREVSAYLATARKRAVSTRTVHMVSFEAAGTTPQTYKAAWCQVTTKDDGEITVYSLAAMKAAGTIPATCPWPPLPGHDATTPIQSPYGAVVASWAATADQGQGGVVKLPLPAAVYFLPDGSIDADLTTPDRQGFSLYMEARSASSSPEDMLKREIYVLPFAGRPRVIDTL